MCVFPNISQASRFSSKRFYFSLFHFNFHWRFVLYKLLSQLGPETIKHAAVVIKYYICVNAEIKWRSYRPTSVICIVCLKLYLCNTISTFYLPHHFLQKWKYVNPSQSVFYETSLCSAFFFFFFLTTPLQLSLVGYGLQITSSVRRESKLCCWNWVK